MSRDPGEDARRQRAGDRGSMLAREGRSKIVDRGQLSLGNLLHQCIHLPRRRDDECPLAPSAAHASLDRRHLGQVLVIRELLSPGLSLLGHEGIVGGSRRVDQSKIAGRKDTAEDEALDEAFLQCGGSSMR